MPRAFIMVLDSFGVGASADADQYGDQQANTLGHIAEYCFAGKADKAGIRKGPLHLPNLTRLGLNGAAIASTGKSVLGLDNTIPIEAAFGCAASQSYGKDTPSGHWELAGVPVRFDWGYFPPNFPSFPPELLEKLILKGNLPGILGNKHASGTEIIAELGEEHQRTGKPIVYTSADSVFQIAAHEESFGLERLLHLCLIARELVDNYQIGRVIARPFKGEVGNYIRTGNRRDYSVKPPKPTLLDKVVASGYEVIAIGKVADIYAHQGITRNIKADGNMALFDTFLKEIKTAPDHSLVFVNLVDFDMLYGHRRDVMGYAHALEDLDKRLPELESLMQPDDIAVITADHGCDPTWPGSDHTREHIPVLVFGPQVKKKSIGRRDSFADVGQTLAKHLGLSALDEGEAFL